MICVEWKNNSCANQWCNPGQVLPQDTLEIQTWNGLESIKKLLMSVADVQGTVLSTSTSVLLFYTFIYVCHFKKYFKHT